EGVGPAAFGPVATLAATMPAAPDLRRGRRAMAAGSWAEAYEAFARADAAVPLAPPDLQAWSTSAYLLGREAAYEELLDRAHQRYLDRGDLERAAYCVCWLALSLAGAGATAQAGGWFARARRLVADLSAETVVHGYLALADALAAVGARRDDEALAAGRRAVEAGVKYSDPDLTALALQLVGRAARGRASGLPARRGGATKIGRAHV